MSYWRHQETKQVRKQSKKPGDGWEQIKGGDNPAPERPVDPDVFVSGPATTEDDPQT